MAQHTDVANADDKQSASEPRHRMRNGDATSARSIASQVPNWFFVRVLPTLLFPAMLMLGAYYFIELPGSTVTLDHRVFQKLNVSKMSEATWTFTTDEEGNVRATRSDDDDGLFETTLTIVNIGGRTVQNDEGYILIEFQNEIVEHEQAYRLPVGTEFRNEKDRRRKGCEGNLRCKVMLGYLKPKGEFNLIFLSSGDLTVLPILTHGGITYPPSSCRGLRRGLQQQCEGFDGGGTKISWERTSLLQSRFGQLRGSGLREEIAEQLSGKMPSRLELGK